jgi:hypothetical protein
MPEQRFVSVCFITSLRQYDMSLLYFEFGLSIRIFSAFWYKIFFICHLFTCEYIASSRVHVKTLSGNTAQKGGTALIRAAAEGRTECVRLLVYAGADTDAQDVVRIGLGGIATMHLYSMVLFIVFLFIGCWHERLFCFACSASLQLH